TAPSPQQRPQARRRDRAYERRRLDVLVRAARGRRRGGVRRPAARLRDHEEHDRRRGGGGALRGSTRVGEEMRPSGRQGARADELWFETSKPDLAEATKFATAIHAKYPGKMLAYNCSPSFNWRKHLSEAQIAAFQQELGALSYKFQFVTLSAFHALNHSMFEL